MRIGIAVAIVLVVGAILAANHLLAARMLSASESAHVRTACADCHKTPSFPNAGYVHDRHPQVSCTTCHPTGPPIVDFNVCESCHAGPRYKSAMVMHDVHAKLTCSRCHADAGLKGMDSTHSWLEAFWIGALGLTLGVIAVNFVVVNRRKGG